MDFNKKILSVDEQIVSLKEKGLIFLNEENAKVVLQNIGLSRFRAYAHVFQNSVTNVFETENTFEDIISLYDFDKRLRTILFNSIEQIELSLRAHLINIGSLHGGSHWHLNSHYYAKKYSQTIERIKNSTDDMRRNDKALNHYKDKYTSPVDPPCWLALEFVSFGNLATLFQNLSKRPIKNEIVNYFGAKSEWSLEYWFLHLSKIRNFVAHHRKIYNRNYPPQNKHINGKVSVENYNLEVISIAANRRIYAWLVVINYMLKIITNSDSFSCKIKELMKDCPLNQAPFMGFPDEWEKLDIWN